MRPVALLLCIVAFQGCQAHPNAAQNSPLVGNWVRKGDRYAGMRVRVVAVNESELAAYIVHPPDDSARAALVKEGMAVDVVAASLQCFARVWAPGLKKWRGIRSVGQSRWSLQDSSKEIRVSADGCNEETAKSVYDTDLELVLEQPNRLKIQNVRIAEAAQIWARTVE